MFLPYAIDILNKRNFRAIQQLEVAAPHIQNLEKLCEQLGAELRDVTPISNNRFAFEVTIPALWTNNQIDLTRLLLEFDHHQPVTELTTGRLLAWSSRGHRLVMTPISPRLVTAA